MISCCEQGHDQNKVYRHRNPITGRFTSGSKQKDVPQQCYKCRSGYHHKCIEPEECGCDCANLIEDVDIRG